MCPAGCLQDRPGRAAGLVELAVAAIGIGLQDAAVLSQVALRVFAPAIARVVEHRSRRRGPAERPVVAHIGPEPGDVGLAPRQHRHRGIVAMQPLGCHDMGLQPLKQRHQHRCAGADLVGQRRQAERHALTGVALGLAIEWLMLTELLEQDHRQQARTRPTPWRYVERGGRLADALAVPAGELLAHMLDDLPGAGHYLQGLGDIFAQLGQTGAAATGACLGARNDDALARQVVRERAPRWARAGEACDSCGLGRGGLGRQFVLRGRGLQFLELQLHLV